LILFLYRAFMLLVYALARGGSLILRRPSPERLGLYPEAVRKDLSVGHSVWLHAASAGEVNAITPFCVALRKSRPGLKIAVTTTSRMGQKVLQETGVADRVLLAPLDTAPALRRAFQAIRPVALLIAETELWPDWLLRAGRNGLPVLLVNGRVSDRSFPSYRRFRRFFARSLGCFSVCLVQTEKDRERLAFLGVPGTRLKVVGQMKYDRSAPEAVEVERFKEKLSLLRRDVFFTLGSLRGDEGDQLLPLVQEWLAFGKDVKVLIAPRHLKNAVLFQEKLKARGTPSVLRSQLEKGADPERVIILDTVGELSLAYAFSRAVFVGGTLVPIGGHNVMEPALSSVPVCFGPHHANVSEAAQALLAAGGGELVHEGAGVTAYFRRCLDEAFARDAGRKGREAVRAMRGATERTLVEVLKHLPEMG
jgi:3-deoxy-D-manno-octulosonic-acid transferase